MPRVRVHLASCGSEDHCQGRRGSVSTEPGFSLQLSRRDGGHVVSSSLPSSEWRPLVGNVTHLGPWGISADGGPSLITLIALL